MMSQGVREKEAGGSGGPRAPSRCAAFTLLELAVGLSLIAAILLGVVVTLGGAFAGGRSAGEDLQSQLFLSAVLAQVEAAPYDTLLSLNGTFVQDGELRADLTARLASSALVQVQVDVTSAGDPNLALRAVLLRADRE